MRQHETFGLTPRPVFEKLVAENQEIEVVVESLVVYKSR
jgi:hypothetical protein